MTLEEVKATEAILEFLLEQHDPNCNINNFRTSKGDKMEEVLKTFCFTMTEFTINLNKKYNIQADPLWISSAKEFFATEKSINFFNKVLLPYKRAEKLNNILQ